MISDLKKAEVITQVHLAEAILHRPKLGAVETFFFSSFPKGYSQLEQIRLYDDLDLSST